MSRDGINFVADFCRFFNIYNSLKPMFCGTKTFLKHFSVIGRSFYQSIIFRNSAEQLHSPLFTLHTH